MGILLSKKRVVVPAIRDDGSPVKGDRAVFSAPMKEEMDAVVFVTLDLQDWEDMSKPDTITVTIEPGDLLNNPPVEKETLTHGEDTMMKVAEAIREVVGDDFNKIHDIVGAMQNRGILFRERV